MGEQDGGLTATDELTIIAKQSLNAVVTKGCQGDRRLANPPGTDESGWSEVPCETNDLLDQLVAPIKVPRR